MTEIVIEFGGSKAAIASVQVTSWGYIDLRQFNTLRVQCIFALIRSGVFSCVFWLLKIPYFYFLGILSRFATLIRTFGLLLALLPPLASGIEFLSKAGVVALLVTVIGAHVVIINVLYPTLIGKRVRLNPLAVVLSLLFWSWIWGVIGLILAVLIAGTVKIVCDYVDSLRGIGAWLGD